MICDKTDEELVELASSYYQEEKLLEAARCLRQVKDLSYLTETHHKWLGMTTVMEQAIADFLATPEGEWKLQGESHGDYDTSIYYKVESGARLTCRIETPIPSSLLVPLLSVLNESGLYHTWIPSWNRPFKLGVRQSKQLLNDRKGHQIIQIQCDVPWPMLPREVLMDVVAVDDVAENGCILAKMTSLHNSNKKGTAEDFPLPPLEPNMERVEFEGAVLFRVCPKDHPNYQKSQQKFFGEENLLLLQYTVFFDAHMSYVPQSLINFVTRTVMGQVWNMLLHVAEQVRDGQRKEHLKVIEEKVEFYKWMEQRCQSLLDTIQLQSMESSSHTRQMAHVQAGRFSSLDL